MSRPPPQPEPQERDRERVDGADAGADPEWHHGHSYLSQTWQPPPLASAAKIGAIPLTRVLA